MNFGYAYFNARRTFEAVTFGDRASFKFAMFSAAAYFKATQLSAQPPNSTVATFKDHVRFGGDPR